MTEYETKNAIITSASLTTEDHGVLSAWLSLDYGASAQGFGGYSLCHMPDSKWYPGKKNYAGIFIVRVLEVVGVSRWDSIPGKTIRVEASNSGVRAIGHITKEIWFRPEQELAE